MLTHETSYRKHSNISCNCSACKQYDYADTIQLQQQRRKHLDIICNCSECRRFDYSETVELPRVAPKKKRERVLCYEIIDTIDTSTGKRYRYYYPVR